MADRISHMAKAMRGWQDQNQGAVQLPKGLFHPNVKIETGALVLRNDNLDMAFTVPFDDDTEANEAEVIVYNLSDHSIAQLVHNQPLTIEAGYADDTGLIFSGRISKVKTKWEDRDRVTTIYALDSEDLTERDLANQSYKKGTRASFILKDLIGKLPLPLAVFKPTRDHTYTDETNVEGGLMDSIRKYAQVCGVSAYVHKGKLYVRDIRDGDNIHFTVEEATGLIGSPAEFEEEITAEDFVDTVHGYDVRMLLQHRVSTASILALKSRNVAGTFRVRSGTHTLDGMDFFTEVKVIE